MNAVFNHRNFWDCAGARGVQRREPDRRARPHGAGGRGGPGCTVLPAGLPHPIRIPDASTASQADGPPLSDMEMSYGGPPLRRARRKMLSSQPHAARAASAWPPTDSVLGVLSRQTLQPGAPGIGTPMPILVQAAFLPQWWDGGSWMVDLTLRLPRAGRSGSDLGPNVFTVAEYNFSLFFGLAIREYERILIADDTPVRPVHGGRQRHALGAQQLRGLQLFLGKAGCVRLPRRPRAHERRRDQQSSGAAQLVELDGRPPVTTCSSGWSWATAAWRSTTPATTTSASAPRRRTSGSAATIGPANLPLSNSRTLQDCVKQQVTSGADGAQAGERHRAASPRILARPFEAATVAAERRGASPASAARHVAPDPPPTPCSARTTASSSAPRTRSRPRAPRAGGDADGRARPGGPAPS